MLSTQNRKKQCRKTSYFIQNKGKHESRRQNKNRSSILLNQKDIKQLKESLFGNMREENQNRRQQMEVQKQKTIRHSNFSNFKNISKQNQQGKTKTFQFQSDLKFTKIQPSSFVKNNSYQTQFISYQDSINTNKKPMLTINQNEKENLRKSALKVHINRGNKQLKKYKKYKKSSLFHKYFQSVGKQSQHLKQFLQQDNQVNTNNKKKFLNCENQLKNILNRQNQSKNKQNSFFNTHGTHRAWRSSIERQSKKIDNYTKECFQNEQVHQKRQQQGCIGISIKFEDQIQFDQFKKQSHSDIQISLSSQTQRQQTFIKKNQAKNQTNAKSQQLIYKQQTQELFKKLNRQIMSKSEIKLLAKKSKNFYQDLRLKLQKQYDQISKSYKLQDKEKQKIGLLIQGCNLQRHRRVNNFYFQKKLFSNVIRPQTAGALNQAFKQINNLNFVTKQRNKTIMRPQTSRPMSGQRSRSRLGKSEKKFSNNNSRCSLGQKGENSSFKIKSLSRLNEVDTGSIFCLTNTELRTQKFERKAERVEKRNEKYKNIQGQLRSSGREKRWKQAMKKQKQQLNCKFDNLLDECDNQNYGCEETKTKMKAFEYYCDKIDSGFSKLSQKIQNYVSKL